MRTWFRFSSSITTYASGFSIFYAAGGALSARNESDGLRIRLSSASVVPSENGGRCDDGRRPCLDDIHTRCPAVHTLRSRTVPLRGKTAFFFAEKIGVYIYTLAPSSSSGEAAYRRWCFLPPIVMHSYETPAPRRSSCARRRRLKIGPASRTATAHPCLVSYALCIVTKIGDGQPLILFTVSLRLYIRLFLFLLLFLSHFLFLFFFFRSFLFFFFAFSIFLSSSLLLSFFFFLFLLFSFLFFHFISIFFFFCFTFIFFFLVSIFLFVFYGSSLNLSSCLGYYPCPS